MTGQKSSLSRGAVRRVSAAKKLGELGHLSAVPALLEAGGDPSPEVVRAAIEALVALRRKQYGAAPDSPQGNRMKTYERQFETFIDLSIYTHCAEEVIDGIENDTVNVFRPDDEHALDNVQDTDGAILLNARATLPVSVREWLPVVCQFIRWECACDVASCGRNKLDNAIAYYRSNAKEVLWPEWGWEAAGPGALVAGIVLKHEKLIGVIDDTTREQCRLKFVLAHELVHAIHAMRFVVPAFMDWRTFWRDVLHEGGCCDLVANNSDCRTSFLDDYGSENELAEVLQFWPSQGKEWFEACHSPPPG